MALIKQANLSEMAREAVVLDLGDLARQGETILARARARAAQVEAEARVERARIIEGAREEGFAAGLAKGLEQGRSEGREQGYAAALAERREALAGLEAQWLKTVEGLSADRDRLLADARRDVLVLATRIARMVTHRQVEANPGVVTEQLAAVLELVMRPSRVQIALNPADRGIAEAALPELARRFSNATHIELTEDAGLTRGSCVARLADGGANGTPGGLIDASIETQLERIVSALIPMERAVEPAGGSGGEPSGGAA